MDYDFECYIYMEAKKGIYTSHLPPLLFTNKTMITWINFLIISRINLIYDRDLSIELVVCSVPLILKVTVFV